MLVLKRRVGESITIGDNITITLKKSSSSVAHFAINAPKSVVVMRTELIKNAKNEENKMTNTQARLEGAKEWNNYGDVAMYDAAKQEAIKAAHTTLGTPECERLVEVRWEDDDTIPAIMVRVKTVVSAEIINPRRGSD